MRPSDVLRARLRANLERAGAVFAEPAGEESVEFFLMGCGWLASAGSASHTRVLFHNSTKSLAATRQPIVATVLTFVLQRV